MGAVGFRWYDTPTTATAGDKAVKAGANMSNLEMWRKSADDWKRKAEALTVELIETRRRLEELEDSLDHIAEIAAPERVMDSERLERSERMLEMLLTRLGIDMPPGPQTQDHETEKDEPEEDDEDDEDEEENPQPAAKTLTKGST